MPDPTAGQEPGSRPQTPDSTTGPDRATQVAPPPTGPVTAARQLLPDNPVSLPSAPASSSLPV